MTTPAAWMSLTIALDAMGGDAAPEIVVDGRRAWRWQQHPDLRFLLFGDAARLEPLLAANRSCRERATRARTRPTRSPATPSPRMALRQGRNTSMRLAINAVKDGEAAAAVSAGNTGALMAHGQVRAEDAARHRPAGDRPRAAGAAAPGRRPRSRRQHRVQPPSTCSSSRSWARSSRASCSAWPSRASACSTSAPRSSRATTWCAVPRRCCARAALPIDFHGFVEGTDVTEGVVDVVVTDGFTGNVALKIAEGTAAMFTAALREAFRGGGWRAKLGYLLARPALRSAARHGSTRGATTAPCSWA